MDWRQPPFGVSLQRPLIGIHVDVELSAASAPPCLGRSDVELNVEAMSVSVSVSGLWSLVSVSVHVPASASASVSVCVSETGLRSNTDQLLLELHLAC